jgi:hypothetical protein
MLQENQSLSDLSMHTRPARLARNGMSGHGHENLRPKNTNHVAETETELTQLITGMCVRHPSSISPPRRIIEKKIALNTLSTAHFIVSHNLSSPITSATHSPRVISPIKQELFPGIFIES